MPSAGFEPAIPAAVIQPLCGTDGQTAGVQALKLVQPPAVGRATGSTAIPTQT
jgi:hypothetical protein